MEEIWKDIPDYEGLYQVSNSGRVKSLSRSYIDSMGRNMYIREKILSLKLTKTGYLNATLCLNGKMKHIHAHQLVAIAFLNHKPCGFKLVVNHINFIKTDNRVENLEIVLENVTVYLYVEGTELYTTPSVYLTLNEGVTIEQAILQQQEL